MPNKQVSNNGVDYSGSSAAFLFDLSVTFGSLVPSRGPVSPQPSTLNPQPSTLNPQP